MNRTECALYCVCVVFSEHCSLISFCRAVCRSRWVCLRWTYVHFIGSDMNCFILFSSIFTLFYVIWFFSFVDFFPDFVLCLNVCYGVRRTHIECIFVDIYRTCAFSYVLYLFAFEMMHEPNWIRAAKNIYKLLTNRPNAHTHTTTCEQTNIRVQFVERYRSFSVDLFKYISVCRVDRSYELSRNCNVFILASNALILRFFVLNIEWKIPLYWHTHIHILSGNIASLLYQPKNNNK